MTPYTRPPVSTDSTTRDRLRDCRNLRQFAVFHHIPPHSAEFCQDHDPNPILPRARVNQATKLTIYTIFPLFPDFISLRNVLTLKFRIALNRSSEFNVGRGSSPGHVLHPFLLALHTNLAADVAKLGVRRART